MDDRRERKTLGKLAANSEASSRRLDFPPETPAAASSSPVPLVRFVSRVGDFLLSPLRVLEVPVKSKAAKRGPSSNWSTPDAKEVKFTHADTTVKSKAAKRGPYSSSWSTPDPKEVKLTHGDKAVILKAAKSGPCFNWSTPDPKEVKVTHGDETVVGIAIEAKSGSSNWSTPDPKEVKFTHGGETVKSKAAKRGPSSNWSTPDAKEVKFTHADTTDFIGWLPMSKRRSVLTGKCSNERLDTKSEIKIKAKLSDEGPDAKSERKIKAKVSDEAPVAKSQRKITAKLSDEGPDAKSQRKIKPKLSDEGPDAKSERKIKAKVSDEGPDAKSQRKIKAKQPDVGLDTKSERKIKADLSAEGLDTKSNRKIVPKLSAEGLDTKSESQVEIGLLQKKLGTKWEKCEINRLGVVWKPQGIQAAACITFPQNAVTQPVLFICSLLEDPMHHPPLKKDEALVSDVIKLSYDDAHGSDFTGDFGEMVSVALPHSASNLRGYEIVIRELVDSHNNDWRDLETTNTWQASGEVPFAEAKVTCCSSFAVVCRLKSYTYTSHALEDRDFICTVKDYPDVSVTVPASVAQVTKKLQLTLKVQEIPRQWYEDSGVIVGPVLHITCSPEIQLFDPATITLPFSLHDNNECAALSPGNVRVLVNAYEEDENETNPRADWEEITTQLPRPAELRNGVVTFQVTHFSWYTVVWDHLAEQNRKRNRGASRRTWLKSPAIRITKSHAFRITGRIPQAGCFFACLCTTDSECLPPGMLRLTCFCCPVHVESRVKEIIRSTEGAILYGGGESTEPLCADDKIKISLQQGLEADADTTDDETQLRFRGDRLYNRDLMVKWTGKRKCTPKVDFLRCLAVQSQRTLLTCNIARKVEFVESEPVAVRYKTPTRQEVFNMSQELGSQWKSLGRQLGIDEHLLTKFRTENAELEERAYQMLLHWKRKHASCATYQILFKALCDVSRKDLAEKYCFANASSS